VVCMCISVCRVCLSVCLCDLCMAMCVVRVLGVCLCLCFYVFLFVLYVCERVVFV